MSDEPVIINHSHEPGKNKVFWMRHPDAGDARVGDWQEAEFIAAGWKRITGKEAKAAADAAAKAAAGKPSDDAK